MTKTVTVEIKVDEPAADAQRHADRRVRRQHDVDDHRLCDGHGLGGRDERRHADDGDRVQWNQDADRRARIGRLVSQVARLYKAPIRSLPSLHGPLSQPRERG